MEITSKSYLSLWMHTAKLKERRIECPKLDSVIRSMIPSGGAIRDAVHKYANNTRIKELRCIGNSNCHVSIPVAEASIGTLGGGNHFIEVDADKNGEKYLVVHTGSRRLGKDIADYYQQLAYEELTNTGEKAKRIFKEMQAALIAELKAKGRTKDIQAELAKLKVEQKHTDIPYELAYLEGSLFHDYIHDMQIAQEYAYWNRKAIFDERNTYSPDGRCFLEVSECMGDLDPALREIVKACKSAGLEMDFYITYFGDAEGGYMYRNGVYETLGREDLCLQEISDTALLAEIRRRRLMQKISNDCVRDFMKSELVQQYGFTEEQASKAAVFAFEHYINTEGATQYDGIERAVEEFNQEKREYVPIVYLSQSCLKEYWDDYAIAIEFQDGTDALAQDNGYTLEQCLTMRDVKFFLS